MGERKAAVLEYLDDGEEGCGEGRLYYLTILTMGRRGGGKEGCST